MTQRPINHWNYNLRVWGWSGYYCVLRSGSDWSLANVQTISSLPRCGHSAHWEMVPIQLLSPSLQVNHAHRFVLKFVYDWLIVHCCIIQCSVYLMEFSIQCRNITCIKIPRVPSPLVVGPCVSLGHWGLLLVLYLLSCVGLSVLGDWWCEGP